jgi:ABC-2 type transport system permease protein
MLAPSRYLRLIVAQARYGLARELAFRGNFLVKVSVEVLWFFLLIAFWQVVFSKTDKIVAWEKNEYMFFVGCYFALAGLIETLFLENCSEFGELVRTGDLDFILLKPIDEQFLVSYRGIDWAAAPNVLMGGSLMGVALYQMGWPFDPLRALLFLVMFFCGVAIAYSCLLFLTSSAVWLVRNQNLMEMWWLFTSLMRYPKEIYAGRLASPLGWFFWFIVPILLVTNVPARVMIREVFDPGTLVFTAAAACALLAASRWFFRLALRRYRSASS